MTTAKLPRISVCVPAYNAGPYIARTLESLLAQDYPDYEIIVSDNQSTDGTAEIVKRYAAETGRVRYVSMPQHGTCEDNLNNCAGLGDGEFVAIYHADDIYYKDALKRSAQALVDDPGLGAVVMLADRIDQNDRKLGGDVSLPPEPSVDYDFSSGLSETLRAGSSPFVCSSAMYRRISLTEHGLYWNRKRYVTASDLGIFLELLKHLRIRLIRERLMGYRITVSQGSNTVIRRRTAKADFFKVLRDYRMEIVGNKFHNNFYLSLVKDLLVRALNFTYDGEIVKSDRRLRAFFRVFSGKIGFLYKFPSGYAMLLLGAILFASNHLPIPAWFRMRLVAVAFKVARPGGG